MDSYEKQYRLYWLEPQDVTVAAQPHLLRAETSLLAQPLNETAQVCLELKQV
jgi:hypothetical protein